MGDNPTFVEPRLLFKPVQSEKEHCEFPLTFIARPGKRDPVQPVWLAGDGITSLVAHPFDWVVVPCDDIYLVVDSVDEARGALEAELNQRALALLRKLPRNVYSHGEQGSVQDLRADFPDGTHLQFAMDGNIVFAANNASHSLVMPVYKEPVVRQEEKTGKVVVEMAVGFGILDVRHVRAAAIVSGLAEEELEAVATGKDLPATYRRVAASAEIAARSHASAMSAVESLAGKLEQNRSSLEDSWR